VVTALSIFAIEVMTVPFVVLGGIRHPILARRRQEEEGERDGGGARPERTVGEEGGARLNKGMCARGVVCRRNVTWRESGVQSG
jgi:hypothetical protein